MKKKDPKSRPLASTMVIRYGSLRFRATRTDTGSKVERLADEDDTEGDTAEGDADEDRSGQ